MCIKIAVDDPGEKLYVNCSKAIMTKKLFNVHAKFDCL